MDETTRKTLVTILEQEMGIVAELVARDGATSDGFYVFVGKKFNVGERLRKFVTWTPVQKIIIEDNKDLFEEWFND